METRPGRDFKKNTNPSLPNFSLNAFWVQTSSHKVLWKQLDDVYSIHVKRRHFLAFKIKIAHIFAWTHIALELRSSVDIFSQKKIQRFELCMVERLRRTFFLLKVLDVFCFSLSQWQPFKHLGDLIFHRS